MKIVGVIGYSNSGKTTLICKLIKEFQKRKTEITVIKHKSCGGQKNCPKATENQDHNCEIVPEVNEKDTHKYSNLGASTILFSHSEAHATWKKTFNLEELLTHVNTELVIVEGNKSARNYPRIVCTDGKESPENLFAGLEVAQYGKNPYSSSDAPVVNDISKLCDIIEEKAFKLPSLDCGECGYKNCHEMGKAIVKNEKSINDCTSLHNDVNIWINGEKLPAKTFVKDCFRGTITGFLQSLKGVGHIKDVKIEF